VDSWIKNLWEKNKIIFFILLPLVLLVFFKDFILELLIGSARKMANKAKEKDSSLKAEEDKLNNDAEKHKTEADRLNDEIENGKDPDEDWHKK